MRKSFAAIVCVCAALAGIGCGSGEGDKARFEHLLSAQARAMEAENLDASMAIVHPRSGIYASNKELTQRIFDVYDLAYEIERVEIVSGSSDEVLVRVVQVTRRLDGPDFQDNRLTMIHTFMRHEDEWKIIGTEIESTEFLE